MECRGDPLKRRRSGPLLDRLWRDFESWGDPVSRDLGASGAGDGIGGEPGLCANGAGDGNRRGSAAAFGNGGNWGRAEFDISDARSAAGSLPVVRSEKVRDRRLEQRSDW